MGAELWYHQAPWHTDPQVALQALQALQAEFVAGHYDLPGLLSRHLDSARQAVAVTQTEGDPYGLLETYQDELQLLERLSAEPIPTEPLGRIELVRQVSRFSGEGVGNVLDVKRVAEERDYPCCQSLSEAETARLVGNSRPTAVEARQGVGRINGVLHRGEAVCFAVYDDARSDPVGWYFVGNTID
jgi:hypothetical protein